MLVLDNKVAIKKDYRFDEFKETYLYNNQQDGRLFWLQKPCHINKIEGVFKVGL